MKYLSSYRTILLKLPALFIISLLALMSQLIIIVFCTISLVLLGTLIKREYKITVLRDPIRCVCNGLLTEFLSEAECTGKTVQKQCKLIIADELSSYFTSKACPDLSCNFFKSSLIPFTFSIPVIFLVSLIRNFLIVD